MARVEMDEDAIKGIERHRARAEKIRTRFRRTGRVSGVVIGAAIVLSLLVVPPDASVDGWVWVVWLAGGWVPALMVAMVLVDHRYGKWITKRVEKLARQTTDTLELTPKATTDQLAELVKIIGQQGRRQNST